jgi:hypothetical protein
MNPRNQAITGFLLILAAAFAILFFSGQFDQKECDSYDTFNCPGQCMICPPCEVCSSVACRSEAFCESLGFDRSWWDAIESRLSQTG